MLALPVFVVLFCSVLFLASCSKDVPPAPVQSQGTSAQNCNYNPYVGSLNCGANMVQISASACCPASSPFWCSTQNSCFTTCASASQGCTGYVNKGQ